MGVESEPSTRYDRLVEETLLRVLFEHSLERGHDSPKTNFDEIYLRPTFKRLGITIFEKQDIPRRAIALDIERHFGLDLGVAETIVGGLNRDGMSSTKLPAGVDKVLDSWGEEGVFKLLSGPCQYDGDGKRESPDTKLRGVHLVPSGRSHYYCLYEGHPIIICLEDVNDRDSRDGWFWQVTVQWAANRKSGMVFVEALSKQLERYLVENRRGKILSSNYDPLRLKKYSFDDLAFPATMCEAVRDLVTTFDNWQSPDCSVANWGALLVGEPGVGKTTIGGILLERMQGHCTALYCPASDFLNLPHNVNPQLIIRDVLKWARLLSPTLLIIDDFDLVVPQRGGYGDQITSCFMEGLDGLQSDGRIFRLFTSNRGDVIESAILNRPGRIGTKILLEGFNECFTDLLRAQAHLHLLPFDESVMKLVVQTTAYKDLLKLVPITPDIAKNVIDRVELAFGKVFTAHALTTALRHTTKAFRNEKQLT